MRNAQIGTTGSDDRNTRKGGRKEKDYKRVRKKLFGSLYPHEPRKPRFASFEMMNMVNQDAYEELYSLQVAEIFSNFIGVHNKQSTNGLMSNIKPQDIMNYYGNKRCTCHITK